MAQAIQAVTLVVIAILFGAIFTAMNKSGRQIEGFTAAFKELREMNDTPTSAQPIKEMKWVSGGVTHTLIVQKREEESPADWARRCKEELDAQQDIFKPDGDSE